MMATIQSVKANKNRETLDLDMQPLPSSRWFHLLMVFYSKLNMRAFFKNILFFISEYI